MKRLKFLPRLTTVFLRPLAPLRVIGSIFSTHHSRSTSVCLLLLLPALPLFAQQTSNHELRAVPAEKPLVMDGNLEEWDLSGEILMCYDLATLLDTHSVRVAAMYDDDYLYLSFRFKDRRPMINNVDPDTEHNRGWRADAVQLRLWSGRSAHDPHRLLVRHPERRRRRPARPPRYLSASRGI
jgi:hypothetical protein